MSDHLLWVDLETTGTDPELDYILEVAMFVTDYDLNVVEPMFHEITPFGLDERTHIVSVAPVVDEMHNKNGLWKECHELYNEQVKKYGWLHKWYPEWNLKIDMWASQYGPLIVAGSGVHFDREFLKNQHLVNKDVFHYRLFDTSSIGRFLEDCCDLDQIRDIRKSRESDHRARGDIEAAYSNAVDFRDLLRKYFDRV